jgi:RNA polymerase sigma factor (TIGR02999 family)
MDHEVTRILNAIEQGDQRASEALMPLVYDELRRLAGAKMKQERKGHLLQPTALVHEAFVRLVGKGDWRKWDGRGHFFAAAAEAMRRILIEQARRKNAEKRGGAMNQLSLEDIDVAVEPENSEYLLALDVALVKLASLEPELVKIVELRYFTGLSVEQTATALGVSERTVKRHWAYARAWLQREMDDSRPDAI